MDVTVLGSGTAEPHATRGSPGFLLRHHGQAWLVDGGSGTLQRCMAAGVRPRHLAGGLYTHHHPDHCTDLVPLVFSMRLGPVPRQQDYPIWAGLGFAVLLEGLEAAWGRWLRPGDGRLVLTELPLDRAAQANVGPLLLRTLPADHGAGALHLRLEAEGVSVVFSGDTGPHSELATLASGADLLICECGGSDDQPLAGHLCPTDIARLVDHARPAQVWLTHLYPQVDSQRALATVAEAGVPTRLARDGDRWLRPG